ncbi:MAG: indole-3-glycerol-phosphate synthase [Candidatus Bathyarchaeota archaeon]|nr:indole-3-glycerol-phosphate synthase [Candidatus Bathyarchaeota archaeon]
MLNFLDTLALNAKGTIASGYYQTPQSAKQVQVSLKQTIIKSRGRAVITEIKTASPSLGTIREQIDPKEVAKAMERGGATGLSVLTEPKHFNGSLDTLIQAREATKLPILMKDIILSPRQIEKAAEIGANAILLIQGLFERGYGEMGLNGLITFAHARGIEVLLETHTEQEFAAAIKTDADLVGVNNRNLDTLKIDLETTKTILQKQDRRGKIVISESGIKTPQDVAFLRGCGADGFLIGSSIMLTQDIELKVKEFTQA